MNLHKCILTENACYQAGRKIKVKGIMVHSTGANNPWLKRYVGPDDGLLGKNPYNNHWNTYKHTSLTTRERTWQWGIFLAFLNLNPLLEKNQKV